MRVNYVNFNGRMVLDAEPVIPLDNRGFRYGDGLFETMLWQQGRIRFLDYHALRLQQGMKTLHIEKSSWFSAVNIENLCRELIARNELEASSVLRLRLQVYREGAGLYSPANNQPGYVLSVVPVDGLVHTGGGKTGDPGLIVDLYTEQFKPASGLSSLKSTNSQVYVLAGLYRKQRSVDEVLILNQDGYLCEAVSSNVFVVYDKKIYTPALEEGCVAGVIRQVVLEQARKSGIGIVEARIDPATLDEAEEVFLTNAIRGVQWVMGYRHKRYFNHWAKIFRKQLSQL